MENTQLKSKQVLYVGSPELCTNYRWEKKSELLNPKIGFVCIDDIISARESGIEIMTCNNAPVCEGAVLVNHPFKNNTYMDVMLAEDELFRQKLDVIGTIARHLGVMSFTAKAKFENIRKYEFEANGNVKLGRYVNLDAEHKHQEEEKYAMQYSREERFPGKYDMENYKEAQRLVNQYQLSELKYLLEQRNPNFSNSLRSQKIKTELSKELNDITECAFSLSILGGCVAIGGSLKETLSTQKKVMLETELIF